MKRKPTVGQRMFSLNVGNAARHRDQVLTPVVVSKVGRKYFTAKRDNEYGIETEYRLDDWRENHEFSPNSKLYETKEEWEDEKECERLLDTIHKTFDHGAGCNRFKLETLRQIVNAIRSCDK